MSGTGLGPDLRNVRRLSLPSASRSKSMSPSGALPRPLPDPPTRVLRASYAMSGTDLARALLSAYRVARDARP
eukprot:1001712-Rhodomonas_salina.2